MENQTKYDIEQQVYKALIECFDKQNVHLDFCCRVQNHGIFIPDIVVTVDSEYLMAVEVKRILPKDVDIRNKFEKIGEPIDISCLIYTDGEQAIVVNFNNESDIEIKHDSFVQTISSIANTINVINKKITLKEIKQKISTAIAKAASIKGADAQRKKKQKHLNTYINSLKATDFEQKGNIVSFKSDAESKFFQHLLDTYQKDYIERFSSSRNLFIMLEKGTINMCSLICMNDPSEQNYADTYTGCKDASYDANSTFILSACPEDTEEDLTMWRLYADDAKGVCVKFKINHSKIGKNGFYLAPISYATENDFHFELEVAKHLFTKETKEAFVFSFPNWNIWKHFFKKKEYSIEKEIRLVYIPDINAQSRDNIFDEQVWFMDDKTSIYSEMKLFKLDGTNPHFPLTVDKIYLGIKFPARDENVKQFQQCLETRKVFMTSQQKDIFTLVDSNYR